MFGPVFLKRMLIVSTFAMVALLVIGVASVTSYRSGLVQVEANADAQLERAVDRLLGQLGRYRYLPTVLSRHPLIKGVVLGETAPEDTNGFLLQTADVSGALDIYVMNNDGITLAASNAKMPRSFVGNDYSWRPYFLDAMQGRLGFFHARGFTTGQRGFFFARSILDDAKQALGVVTVKVDLERVEAEWRGDADVLLFEDAAGVIFLSNRDHLVFRTLDPALLDMTVLRQTRQYPAQIPALPEHRVVSRFGQEFWIADAPGLPDRSLTLTRYVPQIQMTARILADTSPALRQAAVAGSLAAAALAVMASTYLFLLQRRRRLEERLMLEAGLTADLERRVEARTAELTETQDRLVQAGKLSALGQMSAGISHELNQPIAAIQTFADNSTALMERGREADVRSNLTEISALTRRMARIIKNLRAFARKEATEIGPVDVTEAIEGAFRLAEIRATREHVTLKMTGTRGLIAMGGQIRLQQVLVNLINNAMDAMTGSQDKTIEIGVEERPRQILVSITDQGPGLNAPDRVFEPFYTTKAVDQGHGLGLGLSISYGIVQSFGGDITGRNRDEGGAVFVVALQKAKEAKAA